MKRKNRFSLSKSAVACCLIAVSSFTSTGVNAFAADNVVAESVQAVSTDSVKKSDSYDFIVNSKYKNYKDLAKAAKVAGFNFKVPDYAADGYIADSGIDVVDKEDNKTYLSLQFSKTDENKNFSIYSIEITKENPSELFSSLYKDYEGEEVKAKSDISTSEKTMGSIKGQDITITQTYSGKDNEGSVFTSKYFAWEDNGIYYMINYYQHVKYADSEYDSDIIDISEDDTAKIAGSMKSIQDVKNVKYFSDNVFGEDYYGIYDTEDLENGSKILGFTPKFISKVNDKSDIKSAEIRKNNNKFDFIMYYSYEADVKEHDNYFTLYEEKDDSDYNDMKNGKLVLYKFDDECKPSKSEKITINNKEVYKIKEEVPEEHMYAADEYKYVYMWENNGIYYRLENQSQENSFDSDLESVISDIMNK